MGELHRMRLGDCWVDGCLRDAYTKLILKDPITGKRIEGLICDEHAAEHHEGGKEKGE